MKTLLCLAITFGSSAFAADAVIRVQSIPHTKPSGAIAANLIQGIAGIGQGVSGVGLPCVNCFGIPAGTILVPPAYSIVNPLSEPEIIYYYVVETGNTGGTATSTVNLIEATTGKVTQHLSGSVTLLANSTNLLTYFTSVPDHDGYKGAEILVFTTTLGTSTVQGRVYLWME
jgi:hypothetical protein